ncbi:MAG TPA: diguanylate cyclase [Gemmatimonadaceae bacterium]|nr:diguanylate cyclase [Gemmatimonadaceae bacterium]
MIQPTAVLFFPTGREVPPAIEQWLAQQSLGRVVVADAGQIMQLALRSRPRVVIMDARDGSSHVMEASRRLKTDSYTAIVPTAILCGVDDNAFGEACSTLADEIVRDKTSSEEVAARLDLMLRRSDRDTEVHPSTRLPGTTTIEAEITRRLDTGEPFAVCYADLDFFKEYNDRYSYRDGDRVIRILATILHDVAKGVCGERGFVGHIGGDDFIFIIPSAAVPEVCGEIVAVFDLLIPHQYSDQDQRAGYFFGKDRRGHLHRVPLMTLSIGVITNSRRHFTSAREVSDLATEMKSYAKTLPGSVYSVDRRTVDRPVAVDQRVPFHTAASGTK